MARTSWTRRVQKQTIKSSHAGDAKSVPSNEVEQAPSPPDKVKRGKKSGNWFNKLCCAFFSCFALITCAPCKRNGDRGKTMSKAKIWFKPNQIVQESTSSTGSSVDSDEGMQYAESEVDLSNSANSDRLNLSTNQADQVPGKMVAPPSETQNVDCHHTEELPATESPRQFAHSVTVPAKSMDQPRNHTTKMDFRMPTFINLPPADSNPKQKILRKNTVAKKISKSNTTKEDKTAPTAAVTTTLPNKDCKVSEPQKEQKQQAAKSELPSDRCGRNPSVLLEPLKSKNVSFAKLPKLVGLKADSTDTEVLYKKNERLEKKLSTVTSNATSSVLSDVFNLNASQRKSKKKRGDHPIINACDLSELFRKEQDSQNELTDNMPLTSTDKTCNDDIAALTNSADAKMVPGNIPSTVADDKNCEGGKSLKVEDHVENGLQSHVSEIPSQKDLPITEQLLTKPTESLPTPSKEELLSPRLPVVPAEMDLKVPEQKQPGTSLAETLVPVKADAPIQPNDHAVLESPRSTVENKPTPEAAITNTSPNMDHQVSKEHQAANAEHATKAELPSDRCGRNPSALLEPLKSKNVSFAKLPNLVGLKADSTDTDVLYKKSERLEKKLSTVTSNVTSSVLSDVLNSNASQRKSKKKRGDHPIIDACDLSELFNAEQDSQNELTDKLSVTSIDNNATPPESADAKLFEKIPSTVADSKNRDNGKLLELEEHGEKGMQHPISEIPSQKDLPITEQLVTKPTDSEVPSKEELLHPRLPLVCFEPKQSSTSMAEEPAKAIGETKPELSPSLGSITTSANNNKILLQPTDTTLVVKNLPVADPKNRDNGKLLEVEEHVEKGMQSPISEIPSPKDLPITEQLVTKPTDNVVPSKEDLLPPRLPLAIGETKPEVSPSLGSIMTSANINNNATLLEPTDTTVVAKNIEPRTRSSTVAEPKNCDDGKLLEEEYVEKGMQSPISEIPSPKILLATEQETCSEHQPVKAETSLMTKLTPTNKNLFPPRMPVVCFESNTKVPEQSGAFMKKDLMLAKAIGQNTLEGGLVQSPTSTVLANEVARKQTQIMSSPNLTGDPKAWKPESRVPNSLVHTTSLMTGQQQLAKDDMASLKLNVTCFNKQDNNTSASPRDQFQENSSKSETKDVQKNNAGLKLLTRRAPLNIPSSDKLDRLKHKTGSDCMLPSMPLTGRDSSELIYSAKIVKPNLLRSGATRTRSLSDSYDNLDLLKLDRRSDGQNGSPSAKATVAGFAIDRNSPPRVISKPKAPIPPSTSKTASVRTRTFKEPHPPAQKDKTQNALEQSSTRSLDIKNRTYSYEAALGKFARGNLKHGDELPTTSSTPNFTTTKSNLLRQIIDTTNPSFKKIVKSEGTLPRTQSYSDSSHTAEQLIAKRASEDDLSLVSPILKRTVRFTDNDDNSSESKQKGTEIVSPEKRIVRFSERVEISDSNLHSKEILLTKNQTAGSSRDVLQLASSEESNEREQLRSMRSTSASSSRRPSSLQNFTMSSFTSEKRLTRPTSSKKRVYTDAYNRTDLRSPLISIDDIPSMSSTLVPGGRDTNVLSGSRQAATNVSDGRFTKITSVNKTEARRISKPVNDNEVAHSSTDMGVEDMVKEIMSDDTPRKKIRTKLRQPSSKNISQKVLHPDSGRKSPPAMLLGFEQASSFRKTLDESFELVMPYVTTKEEYIEFDPVHKRRGRINAILRAISNIKNRISSPEQGRSSYKDLKIHIRCELQQKIRNLELERRQLKDRKVFIKQQQKEGKIWYKQKQIELKGTEKEIKSRKSRENVQGQKDSEKERKDLKRDKKTLREMAKDEKKWHKMELKQLKDRLKNIRKEMKKVLKEQRRKVQKVERTKYNKNI